MSGIGWHQGGLYYLPAADSRSFELSNFQFRNKTYEIIINGNGAFVEHFDLNGVAIEGTMQIPADIITSPTINWHIVRSETPFDRPILLEATDLPLIQLKSTSQSLCFTAGKHVHAPVVIFSTRIPKVSINGQYINFEYQEEHSLLWLDYFFSKGDIVVIQC